MNKNEKIKELWNVFLFTKELTSKNLTEAVSTGKLKIDPQTLQTIIGLVSSTIDQGYNKTYQKTVKLFDE